ncbi:hypothetical protein SD77_1227 [Bacillus badius]|uniref:Ribose 5-phosphate isomerase B n=1 Tax=Bacillus badius TaxID=1455 RepID=A0ABR5AS15_BACBA|nr:hypothetical protein SD78_3198 [Bacillus badius]KIL77554.1 hypothetical protein SD77_1227 [Bacillus badius]
MRSPAIWIPIKKLPSKTEAANCHTGSQTNETACLQSFVVSLFTAAW